jgi:UDP-N-acetylglucosamine 2-epimerase (non-hydrolysing)
MGDLRGSSGPILCVVGARPNFIKMAPLLKAFSAEPRLPQAVLIHTGQHADAAMSERFFDELDLPVPARRFDSVQGSQTLQTADIMRRFEPVIDEFQPSCAVVVGDVNSTLACALVSAKKQVPVVHVEAGLRSFDRSMPEEINRVMTDHLAELLFTTERDADDNLRREGIPPDRIRLVGNVMVDALHAHRARFIPAEQTIRATGRSLPARYGVVTLHRPANVDRPEVLAEIVALLRDIGARLPLIWPVHPRTRAHLERFGLLDFAAPERLLLLEPLGYHAMQGLMSGATAVLTDSGGIQEETTALGVPCLTLRENTERPVTVEEGTNVVVGHDGAHILYLIEEALAGRGKRGRLPALWDGCASDRIAAQLAVWLASRQAVGA